MLNRIMVIVVFLVLYPSTSQSLERVAVSKDGRGFVLAGSAKPFIVWGFNYDRDYRMRLIEEYWNDEWQTVVAHFRGMKELGANVVRVHLQFEKFMDAPDRTNNAALDRLEKLVSLAEDLGIYLDITGLACYRPKNQPVWYAEMAQKERWAAQAVFWEAVAKRCAGRPGVLAFDLMNEPVVGSKRSPGQWVHPAELGGFTYVQFIALDAGGRDGTHVWRDWAHMMAAAIHRQDEHRLVTVGLLPLPTPEMLTGIAPEVDYMSVHLYPKTGRINQDLAILKKYSLGKPLVIEETFPMECSIDEMVQFIEQSKGVACGWVSFYWGKPLAEMKQSKEPVDRLIAAWLERFQVLSVSLQAGGSPAP